MTRRRTAPTDVQHWHGLTLVRLPWACADSVHNLPPGYVYTRSGTLRRLDTPEGVELVLGDGVHYSITTKEQPR